MKKLKILLFEYITGGGFNNAELPEVLADEGLLMLQALVGLVNELDCVQPVVMLDERVAAKLSIPGHVDVIIIKPEQATMIEFSSLVASCDAVWPIAPESDGILQDICLQVEKAGKLLFNSSSTAVALTGDKWQTYLNLSASRIRTVPTTLLKDFSYSEGEWLIKTIDGVGCSGTYVCSNRQEFDWYLANHDREHFIIQPHVNGKTISLSCLFKQGRGWLVTVNRQEFSLLDQHYQLTGLVVNIPIDHDRYCSIVAEVAKSIPGLWGYVGIDLIEHDGQIEVLEINPRLTTSFAGIKAATGLNCAQMVLGLIDGNPNVRPIFSQTVDISLHEQG